ncbi:MAG: UDP-N-acetylglucosamine 2-epimerase [Candidatus Omnitrophota bacterium]
MKKRIWVVTGSRAEYGLLKPLIKNIIEDGKFALEVIVTGQHLDSRFGLTFKDIEKDGIRISKKVRMLADGDSQYSIAQSVGLGISKFGAIFAKEKPDLLIVLGDRFEIFAATSAAFIFKIPIAHLHGGELTSGSMDDVFRHAVTKMSILHFVSTSEYKRRVVQLGEDPQRVFNVGAIGIDNIKQAKLLPILELEKELKFKLGKRNILVTFHPATLEEDKCVSSFNQLLLALDDFKDVKIIFTKPNVDIGSLEIGKMIDDYVKRNEDRAKAFVSLGTLKYLSLIKNVDAVIGNSSSGIIEVPSFGKPTVNIGNRQKGRIRAKSVIDSKSQMKQISNSIKKALSPEFAEFCKSVNNPYGNGNTARKIYNLIKRDINTLSNLQKIFYTMGEK